MAVAVYPHLDALLRERDLSILELKCIIEDRYNLVVDLATLQSLAGSAPVDQTDLKLAGAVASALGVSLNDLFSVEASMTDTVAPADDSFLSDAASQRLSELLTQQSDGQLDEHDARELRQLMDEYGRKFREHHLRSYAAKQGISFEEAVREADQRIAEAAAVVRRLDNDPAEWERLATRVQQQRASTPR